MTVEKVAVLAEVVVQGSISGRRRVAQVFPLQEERYLAEGRPLVLLSSPALEHQVVDVLGGGGGPRQVVEAVADAAAAARVLLATVLRVGVAAAVAAAVGGVVQLPQALHHFLVRQVLVWHASAEVQDLPQSHRERPHVTLRRVLPLEIKCMMLGSWLLF